MAKPLTPSPKLISEYLGKWQKLENYRLQEASLGLLFHTLCPENKEIEHVLLKVSALNDFYSTNVFDTYSVAKHILKKDRGHVNRCANRSQAATSQARS
jgi:hypothetical protein